MGHPLYKKYSLLNNFFNIYSLSKLRWIVKFCFVDLFDKLGELLL